MNRNPKEVVMLQKELVKECNRLLRLYNAHRCKIISEEISSKINAINNERLSIEKSMIEGYKEMAILNAHLAEQSMCLDLNCLEDYEIEISESD